MASLKKIFKKEQKLSGKIEKSGAYQKGYLAGYHDGLVDAMDKARDIATGGKKERQVADFYNKRVETTLYQNSTYLYC